MNKDEQQLAGRPVLIWENTRDSEGQEATVQELHTGDNVNRNMPVIRIVSSGFGNQPMIKNIKSAGTVSNLRCAA